MRCSTTILSCAAALCTLLFVFCGDDNDGNGPDPTVIDITGQWDGTYGEMAVFQSGDTVAAVYDYRCGRFFGTFTGTRLNFQWWETASGLPYDSAPAAARGDGYLDVLADGDSLKGKWRFEGDSLFDRDWVAVQLSVVADSAVVLAACVPDTSDTSDTTGTPDDSTGIIDTVMPAPGLLRSTNLDDDLLFQIADSGGEAIFFRGRETVDSFYLNHLTYRDSAGYLYGVIMHEYLPVQWILEDMSIAVYRLDDSEPFDPSMAVHVYVSDTVEDSLVLDIFPSSLDSTLARMERLSGLTFPEARQYLSVRSITTFTELKALAENETGEEQLYAMSAAAAFGLAQAACAIGARFDGLGKRQAMMGLEVAFKPGIKVAAGALGHLFGAKFGPGSTGGDGPTVGVLLCQGAAKYGVCHYMFYRMDQLGQCVQFCQTSLGCFTDICMPMDISWEDANNFNNRQFN